MGDQDLLFAAAKKFPHEDLPRGIYADWLEEQGNPELAAFMRSDQGKQYILFHALFENASKAICRASEGVVKAVAPALLAFRNFSSVLLPVQSTGTKPTFGEWLTSLGFVDPTTLDPIQIANLWKLYLDEVWDERLNFPPYIRRG